MITLWQAKALELTERSRTEFVTRAEIDTAWGELVRGAGLASTLARVSTEIGRTQATYMRSLLKRPAPGYDAGNMRREWLRENFELWDKLGAELAGRLADALAQPRLDAKPAGITRAVNKARKANVALVGGLDVRQTLKLGEALKAGQEQGVRHETLIETVQQITGYGGSRARLIARDQTMKYNASVQQAQARAAGITQYRWRVVRDEATRSFHKRLDGTLHTWNDPPVTNAQGDRNHPGQDFQCRCSAEPVIDLFAGLSDE